MLTTDAHGSRNAGRIHSAARRRKRRRTKFRRAKFREIQLLSANYANGRECRMEVQKTTDGHRWTRILSAARRRKRRRTKFRRAKFREIQLLSANCANGRECRMEVQKTTDGHRWTRILSAVRRRKRRRIKFRSARLPKTEFFTRIARMDAKTDLREPARR
jgi:hypothetical protein